MSLIQSSKIKNLITKFYYKENELWFKVLVNYENGETRLYKEYSDYTLYKDAYNNLLNVKNAEEYFLVDEKTTPKTHLSFL